MRTESRLPFSDLPRPAAGARSAVQFGFDVVPLKPRSKAPAVRHGIDDAITSRMGVRAYAKENPDVNYAMVLDGEFFVIDVDGPEGEKALHALVERYGELPPTVETITSRGRHLLFRSRPGKSVPSSSGELGPDIDVKGRRGYIVGAGSVHPSGHVYRYAPGHALGEIKIAYAPDWLLDLVLRSRRRIDEAPRPVAAQREPGGSRITAYGQAALASELATLRRTTEGARNIALNRAAFVLAQLCQAGALDEATIRLQLTKTALAIGLTPAEIPKSIESGMRAGALHPRNLDHLADITAKPRELEPTVDDAFAEELAAMGETDADNARRFARRYRDEVAYVRGLGLLVWDERIWEPAADTAALRRAEASARAIAHEAAYLNDTRAKERREAFAQRSLSKGALDRAVFLARTHLEVPGTKFDARPDLLPVENGTLDLRAGTLGPHDPAHHLTRMAPVVYDATARCPVFLKFLRRSVGDEGVIAFLQKGVGMTLTGDVGEQVLLFLLGDGRTGKSTFVNLLRDLLGSFAVHTPIETFTTKTFDAIRTDLARMAGARMVSAGEIHPSQQFDEALIKGMTGGDPITARFLHKNLIQYTPQFKIWLYANHAPKVRATDDAFWRRIRVVRFDNVVPEHKVEKDLPKRLRAELPGILNWALAGCLAWRAEGLEPPLAVREATQAWRLGADHVARYLRERTVPESGSRVGAAALLTDFGAWCTVAGEKQVSPATFKARLTALGRVSRKDNKGHFWIGLRLRG